MSDSDPITFSGKEPDGFTSIINELMSNVQYKMIFFLFIIFLLLSSDAFIHRVLNKFNGAVSNGVPNSWGTIIQGISLVLAFVMLDILNNNNVI